METTIPTVFPETVKDEYDRATFKQRVVNEGIAHAALVFDGDDAIAWCESGSPLELPGIYHRKQYDAGETNPAPWRITCFFVDRDHRRSGVAYEALEGALQLIALAGGGEVVSFPNELEDGSGRPRPSCTTGLGRCSRRPASRLSATSGRARRLCGRRSARLVAEGLNPTFSLMARLRLRGVAASHSVH